MQYKVYINEITNDLILKEAERKGISKKDYVELCILFCEKMKIDVTNPISSERKITNNKIAKLAQQNQLRKIHDDLEKTLTNKIYESRNTYISFIRELEKNQIKPLQEQINYISEMQSIEFKNIQKQNEATHKQISINTSALANLLISIGKIISELIIYFIGEEEKTNIKINWYSKFSEKFDSLLKR